MNLFKKIASLIAVFAFATTAFGATMNQDLGGAFAPNVGTTVGSMSHINKSSASVGAGDTVYFSVFYALAEGAAAQGVNAKIENLEGRTFNAGSSESVSGSVSASNYSTSAGSVSVQFTDKVKLEYIQTTHQRQDCSSVSCGSQVSSAISSNGTSIGTVANTESYYKGSVVVSYRAIAVNDPEPSDDDADVTTVSASSIDEDSATLNGDLDLEDWNSAEVYFVWGTSSSNLNNTTSDSTRNSDGTFNKGISGLNDDQTYYYQAVGRNPSTGEKVYGSIKSFRTDEEDNGSSSNDDDVTTRSASNIDDDSARLNGDWEGDDNTEVWFAFDENDETPSCNASSQEEGEQIVDDNEDFSKTVSGLDENEKYYFRACAKDSDGDIVSGSIKSFTTDEEDDDDNDDDNVDVTTDSATSVDEDSARLNGEVEGDDNVEVWFAFSRTDSTPSCNVSSQRVSVSGSYDDGDDFSKVVSGLQDNTKYYFRACAEDSDDSIESGSIRSFVTDDEDGNDNNNNNDEDPRAVTNIASGITTSSARLNSIVIGDGDAVCYFQYGRTSSFGLTSPRTAVDLDRSGSCSSTRTGLASNSTYYYRAVVEQDGTRYYGSTRTFQTNRTGTITTPRPVTPTNPTPTDNNTTITIINQNETVVADDEINVTKWVSAENDPRFDTETEAQAGETVYYKVKVTNDTDQDLDDVVVIDRIPFYLELDESSSLDDDDDKQIRWVIDLEEGESRTFITEMRVREDARDGDLIESYASAETEDYSVNSNDVLIEVEDSNNNDNVSVDDNENDGQAANVFGSGFFPTSLTGWGLLLLVILAIAYFFSRIMMTRNENERVLAELHAAQAARTNA